jgi:FkbM family methyltransferase
MNIPNFVVLDSIHGRFIVNRYCDFQAEALIKTGATHIESELQNIFAVIDTLSEGAVIIDGGANAGFFTIPVANRIRDRDQKIISFEPQRVLYHALAGSLALNEINFCDLFYAGLGESPGIAMVPPIDYGVAQDFGMVQISEEGEGTPVEIMTIDGLNLDRLEFIKLDVEGYECAAMRGGIETIQKYRPYVWVEYFISGSDSIKQALMSAVPNYAFFKVDYQNMLCVPREKLARITFSGIDEC